MSFASKIRSIIIVFAFSLFLINCSGIPHIYPEGDFKIMVLSDIHITNSESKDNRLIELIAKVNSNEFPGLELITTTGDNVSSVHEYYNPDSISNSYNRMGRLMDILSTSEVPVYLTMGNHEFKIDRDRDSDDPYEKDEIEEMEKLWEQMTGFKPYYSKEHNGWKLIFLNSMGGRYLERFFEDAQLKWLEEELKSSEPVLIFFHHPIVTDHFRIWSGLSGMIDRGDEPQLFQIFEQNTDKIKGIFVGHGHMWVHDNLYKKIDVYETDSFGDNEDSPFLLIGVDNTSKKINVSRSPLEPM